MNLKYLIDNPEEMDRETLYNLRTLVALYPYYQTARLLMLQNLYILHDPTISRARKMLVIEQFQNPELAKLQTKQNYSDVLGYFTGLMKQLIRQGVLAEDDPEIMAAQFCLPISVWLELCDREPDREQEVMELVEKHIRQFFRHYQPEVG